MKRRTWVQRVPSLLGSYRFGSVTQKVKTRRRIMAMAILADKVPKLRRRAAK